MDTIEINSADKVLENILTNKTSDPYEINLLLTKNESM